MTLSTHSWQAFHPQNANETVVYEAMTALFGKRDTSCIPKYWAGTYLQHNPSIPDGRDDLAGIIESLPANFKYEPGFIASKDDLVFIHGRYEGWGPKPMLAVDIFKVSAFQSVCSAVKLVLTIIDRLVLSRAL